MIKILLAGPGTGKTTNIKSIIKNSYEDKKVLVLSFTNATVNDLNENFADSANVNCKTLHSFALSINPEKESYILHSQEIKILEKLAVKTDLDFSTVCGQLNCITFNSMISACTSFVKNNPAYLLDLFGELDLLIVDEFQDFNQMERDLVFELSKLSKETMILGDDDQSIYGFKDADPEAIINLFNDGSIEKLEHENNCYRCPDSVVDISTNVINHNKNRISKPWNKTGKAGDVYIDQFSTEATINNEVLNRITIILEEGNDSILLLSPMKYPLVSITNYLKEKEIPLVDFIGNAISSEDLERVWVIRSIFSTNQILNVIFLAHTVGLFKRKKFINIVKEGFQNGINEMSVIQNILDLNVIPDYYKSYILNQPNIGGFLAENPDYDYLFEFIDGEKLQDSLNKLIKNLSNEPEFEKGMVNIMTIHKSKGLGADHVFILGVVQGILPNSTYGIDSIEAQRRLLYVGMTRAKKSLHIISQVNWAGRFVHTVNKDEFKYDFKTKTYKGRMSKFIEESK